MWCVCVCVCVCVCGVCMCVFVCGVCMCLCMYVCVCVCVSNGVSLHVFRYILFLLINTQRTSEPAMQYTVLTKLIICCRILLEKLIALHIMQEAQYFSQQRATRPYPEAVQSNAHPTTFIL